MQWLERGGLNGLNTPQWLLRGLKHTFKQHCVVSLMIVCVMSKFIEEIGEKYEERQYLHHRI